MSSGKLVAGRLEGACAAPAPEQEHVLVARVVEAVPVATRREDDVARLGRLSPLVRVDLAAAAQDDEELVGVWMTVALVPGAGRQQRPADDERNRPRRARVDQELHLHVDPALVLAQTLL